MNNKNKFKKKKTRGLKKDSKKKKQTSVVSMITMGNRISGHSMITNDFQ